MQLKAFLIYLRISMWFIPTLMVAGAVLLAYGCISIDNAAMIGYTRPYPQLFAGDADSNLQVLSTIAISMITFSGVTFSLTTLSLAQVSDQLTARVLHNFMGNVTNKFTLGFFAGLFIYCLVVIRTIRMKDDLAGPFIPTLSVFMGVGLAIIGVLVLIYFLHYLSLFIQPSVVISSVANESLAVIDKLYPDQLPAEAVEDPLIVQTFGANQSLQLVLADTNGYIQLVDEKKLIRFAKKHNITVRVDAGAGDFVTQQSPLVSLIGFKQLADGATNKAINRAFSIRRNRTIDEEIAFGICQLVDVALKTLARSKDTTTVVLVLDYLSAVLGRLVQRRFQPVINSGQLVPKHPSFANIMDVALDQIRDAAGGNTVVLTRLLLLIQVVGRPTTNPGRRAVLRHHVRLIVEQANATLHIEYQRHLFRQQLVETLSTLNEKTNAFDDLLKPDWLTQMRPSIFVKSL